MIQPGRITQRVLILPNNDVLYLDPKEGEIIAEWCTKDVKAFVEDAYDENGHPVGIFSPESFDGWEALIIDLIERLVGAKPYHRDRLRLL